MRFHQKINALVTKCGQGLKLVGFANCTHCLCSNGKTKTKTTKSNHNKLRLNIKLLT